MWARRRLGWVGIKLVVTSLNQDGCITTCNTTFPIPLNLNQVFDRIPVKYREILITAHPGRCTHTTDWWRSVALEARIREMRAQRELRNPGVLLVLDDLGDGQRRLRALPTMRPASGVYLHTAHEASCRSMGSSMTMLASAIHHCRHDARAVLRVASCTPTSARCLFDQIRAVGPVGAWSQLARAGRS